MVEYTQTLLYVLGLCRQGKDKKAYAVHYVKDGPKVDSMEAHYEPVTSGEASEPEYAAGMHIIHVVLHNLYMSKLIIFLVGVCLFCTRSVHCSCSVSV